MVDFLVEERREGLPVKRYRVTLEKEEREELEGITRKGSHQSQKVINALILLNCDEGDFNERQVGGEGVADDFTYQPAQGGSGEEALRRTRL